MAPKILRDEFAVIARRMAAQCQNALTGDYAAQPASIRLAGRNGSGQIPMRTGGPFDENIHQGLPPSHCGPPGNFRPLRADNLIALRLLMPFNLPRATRAGVLLCPVWLLLFGGLFEWTSTAIAAISVKGIVLFTLLQPSWSLIHEQPQDKSNGSTPSSYIWLDITCGLLGRASSLDDLSTKRLKRFAADFPGN